MIFGESKPEGEKKELRSTSDVAVFPLATPSLASPGAMMAVVLLTENSTNSIFNQMISSVIMLSVLAASYLLMLAAGFISRIIGDGGASIVSRVMGLILASIATTNVLEGVKQYFQ
jgi:multiple antibiotic resistance protein